MVDQHATFKVCACISPIYITQGGRSKMKPTSSSKHKKDLKSCHHRSIRHATVDYKFLSGGPPWNPIWNLRAPTSSTKSSMKSIFRA